MQLGARAAEDGFRLTYHDLAGSTNDLALAAAEAGDAGRHWFVAGAQSAGRGRVGRAWSSPTGNLYCSLLLIDACPVADLPKLGFVAGVALHAAAKSVAPHVADIALKWPNDLMVDGAKASGILLEGRRLAGGAQAVVIGIGVNCAQHPVDLPYAATNLSAYGQTVSAATLFAALSDAMRDALCDFARGSDFPAIRNAWLRHAYRLGHPIETRNAKGSLHGLFAGIDADGRLLLDGAEGRRAIDAADIVFPGLR